MASGQVDYVAAMTTWQGLLQLDRRRPWLLDAVLALGILAASLLAEAAARQSIPALQILLMVVVAGGYAARRAIPLLALVVTGALVLVMILLGLSTAVIGAGLFLMAYTVAAYRPVRIVLAGAGYTTAILLAIAIAAPQRMPPGELATNLALFAGSFVFGRAARIHRAAAGLEAQRAALAELVQREEARAALTEERLRIAREVHDVVGHSLGVIALQAGVGAKLVDTDPAEAKAALLAIAERSRESLREVRQILGAVRDPQAATNPNPGLAAVPELVSDLADAGLQVELEQRGEPWQLSEAMDLTAYRVLQESLTNVVRHAGTDRAWLRISYAPDEVELRVSDRGRGPAEGNAVAAGQRGMRERVESWGGTVTFGPANGGGYQVVARLPRQEET